MKNTCLNTTYHDENMDVDDGMGSSLGVQWLGHGVSTAVAQVQSLVQDLRLPLHEVAKKEKKKKKKDIDDGTTPTPVKKSEILEARMSSHGLSHWQCGQTAGQY